MYICFEGLREDWLSQLSYPHKIKKLLTLLTYLVTYLLRNTENRDFEKILRCMLGLTKFRGIVWSLYEPRQANLCLRAFRHDKIQRNCMITIWAPSSEFVSSSIPSWQNSEELYDHYMSPVKRICVFEHSVMTKFRGIVWSLYEPRQANLCLRAFRHGKF